MLVPAIAGREIKRRITFILNLSATLLVIGYVLFFESNIYLHVLIFFTSMSMAVPLKLKETCIVNASQAKNMGQKYQKEHDAAI